MADIKRAAIGLSPDQLRFAETIMVLTEDDMIGWPSLDVPRLPSILLTPGDCLDFVLGELFQEAWPKRYEDEDPSRIGRWLSTSRHRTAAILKATLEAAEKTNQTSPWLAIKQWYPKDPKVLLA